MRVKRQGEAEGEAQGEAEGEGEGEAEGERTSNFSRSESGLRLSSSSHTALARTVV